MQTVVRDTAPAITRSSNPGAEDVLAQGERASQILRDYVLIRRTAIPIYYAVLAACTVLAFILGWMTRGSVARVPVTSPNSQQAGQARVLLSGEVRFVAAGGIGQPDRGAVILAVPAQPEPSKPIPIEGLRPWDGDSAIGRQNREKLAEMGGAWSTADDHGRFDLVLPQPGRYWVLIISRNLARSQAITDLPRRGIAELDYQQLARYFERPVDLIGRQNYRWTLEKVDPAGLQITHLFGAEDALGLQDLGQ